MTDIVFLKYHLCKAGGLEKHSYRIINAFLQKGLKITILTTKISNDFIHPNLEIVIIKNLKFFKPLKILSFDLLCKKWIKKHKSKIIFSLDRGSTYDFIRLGIGLHRTFLNQKELFENRFKLLLDKLNITNKILLHIEKKGFYQKNLMKVIVNSNMVKEELISNFNIHDNKIQVIHNGFEFDEKENDFTNWPYKKEINLKKFNLKDENFHFLFIGNDYKRKGLIPLFNALHLIKDENFHLSIVGKDKNIKKYEKLAKKLNIDKKVTFFNSREDVHNFYQFADALILPSFYDPFSNVVIEALSFGLFVVTSKYNGAKEIITSFNGKIVDILDPLSFANDLKNILHLRKTEKSANEIRESVKDLTFETQINKLLDIVSAKKC